jgi:hypothetical protein
MKQVHDCCPSRQGIGKEGRKTVGPISRVPSTPAPSAVTPNLADLRAAVLRTGRAGKAVGKFAHITDALGYALWWLEPRPKAKVSGGVGIINVPVERRGSDFYPVPAPLPLGGS